MLSIKNLRNAPVLHSDIIEELSQRQANLCLSLNAEVRLLARVSFSKLLQPKIISKAFSMF